MNEQHVSRLRARLLILVGLTWLVYAAVEQPMIAVAFCLACLALASQHYN